MSLRTPRGGLKTTRGLSRGSGLKATRGLKTTRGVARATSANSPDVAPSPGVSSSTPTSLRKLGGAARELSISSDAPAETGFDRDDDVSKGKERQPIASHASSPTESAASDSEHSDAYQLDENVPSSTVDQDIFITSTPEVGEEIVSEFEGLRNITEYEWNGRFQAILSKSTATRKDKVERVWNIHGLLSEFEEQAKKSAIIIVDELHLPKAKKTIPPVDAGGVAGGQKFLNEGIFFKLAIDWKKVYSGNDMAAMKAAGHELNGLRAYFRSKVIGLYVPLMVAIDYRGYRLLASSLLPISGSKTLVYGSPDGGKTVNKNNEGMNALMEKAAHELNLKGHWAGSKKARKFLHGPVDLEGHVGQDGKLYVLDTARVFPPESPTRAVLLIPADAQASIRVEQLPDEALGNKEVFIEAVARAIGCSAGDMGIHSTSLGTFYYNTKAEENKRAMLLQKKGINTILKGDVLVVQYNMQVIYYRLLRPELVRDNRSSHYHSSLEKGKDSKLPLCSDAFSRFQLCDEKLHEHNKEVTEATYRLINRVIPSFARKLKTHKLVPVDHGELIECMHASGINVRFLGRIRQRIDASHSHLRSFLLTEMCARVMKHKIRKLMRKCITSRGAGLGSSLRRTGSSRDVEVSSTSGGVGDEAEDGATVDDAAWSKLAQRLVDYLNTCLGKSEASTTYWMGKLKLHIQFKFLHALAEDEARVDYDLRKVVLMFPLFMRLQETTGVWFKKDVQKRLFDHPLTFDMPDPLRTDDVEDIRATTKNILVRTGELKSKLYKALTLEREKDSEEALMSNFGSRDDIMGAYNTLINLYHHKHICDYISTNSPEAIHSYYKLAQSYKQMGDTNKALDFALKGLYYGEVLFGSFSEETMEGLRTVGEIFEHAGKKEETIKFYRRALHAVEKMYFLHPIAGKLHLKLYFLLRERSAAEARAHLQKAYAAYGGIYGYEKARLVVPLLALKNEIQPVVKKMDETLATDSGEGSLMHMAYQFWPAEILESVSSSGGDTEGRVQEVLTRLDLEEHILSFQYHEVDDDTFLELKEDDLKEVGMKHEAERHKLLEEIANINQDIEREMALRAAAASLAEEEAQHVEVEFDEYTVAGVGDGATERVAAVTTAELEGADFVNY